MLRARRNAGSLLARVTDVHYLTSAAGVYEDMHAKLAKLIAEEFSHTENFLEADDVTIEQINFLSTSSETRVK